MGLYFHISKRLWIGGFKGGWDPSWKFGTMGWASDKHPREYSTKLGINSHSGHIHVLNTSNDIQGDVFEKEAERTGKIKTKILKWRRGRMSIFNRIQGL
jgi:hypothetical protein